MYNLDVEHIREKLREAGLKATNQRIAVYGALEALGHASVDSTVSIVREGLPVITVAAVYNILEMMADTGLIGRVLSSGKMMYDITPCYHDHLLVDGGREVIDLDDPEIHETVERYFSSKKIDGFRVKGARIYVEVERMINF